MTGNQRNEKYVSVFSSNNPTEIQIVKHALGHAGIDFRTKGETILQGANIYATGIEGATIEVRQDQMLAARQLLRKLDLIADKLPQKQNPLSLKFERYTNGIPLLNELPVPLRWLVVFFLAIAIPLVIYALLVS